MKKVAFFLLLFTCICMLSCKKDCICTTRNVNIYGEEKIKVNNYGKMSEKNCKKFEYEKEYQYQTVTVKCEVDKK